MIFTSESSNTHLLFRFQCIFLKDFKVMFRQLKKNRYNPEYKEERKRLNEFVIRLTEKSKESEKRSKSQVAECKTRHPEPVTWEATNHSNPKGDDKPMILTGKASRYVKTGFHNLMSPFC